MKRLFLFCLVIVLSACSAGQATPAAPDDTGTGGDTATATLQPSATATVPPTATMPPTDTPEPTSTATPTQLPQALKDEILQAYKVLLLIQVNANMVNETAARVNSGELSGLNSFITVIAVAGLIQAVDEAIAEITPPDMLQESWEDALVVHQQTKDILGRWVNKDIDSSVVLEEIGDPIESMGAIMLAVDEALSTRYGFDLDEMVHIREETIASINEIFNTPTPTP